MSSSHSEFALTDFHRALLHSLPDEGSRFGYHPLAKSVKRLTEELNGNLPAEFPRLTSNEVAAEVRSLKVGGFVVDVKSGTRLIGWQRTSVGAESVRGWAPPTFDQDGSR